MIHPDTQIQYLDIKDGEPRYKSINEFYQEYAHKSILKMDTNNIQEFMIDFSLNPHVKITDLFGWTDVLEIRKLVYRHPLRINWVDVLVANKQLITCNRELLPVYGIDKNRIGFHGEVKYQYTLTTPTKISDGYLRVHNGEDGDGNSLEFAVPQIIDPGNSGAIDASYGYEIITKSRFYNGNDIHLFGYDYINFEEVLNWYK